MSPPEENRANYPYVEESVVGPTLSPTVGATVEGVPSEAGFMGAAGLGKPYTSFSYNPTIPTKPSQYSYSPLPPVATPTTSPKSFIHLGRLPMSAHVQVKKPQDEASFQAFGPPVAFPEFSVNHPLHFQPLTQQPKPLSFHLPRGGGAPPENVVRHLPVPRAQYLPTFAKEFAAAKDHFAQVRWIFVLVP